MKPRTTIFLSGVSHEFGSFRDAVEVEIHRLIVKHRYLRRQQELEDAPRNTYAGAPMSKTHSSRARRFAVALSFPGERRVRSSLEWIFPVEGLFLAAGK